MPSILRVLWASFLGSVAALAIGPRASLVVKRSGSGNTNADRFARGLPPAPQALFARKVTPVSPLGKQVTLACPSMSGTLVAFDAETGLVVDPLANVMNNGRIMLATSDDPSTHLKASKVGCGSLAELALENAVLSDSDWRLGAIVGADSTSALKPGRSDYLYLGASQSIPANQGPGYVPNSYSDSFGASSYPSETTIFSVHADGTIISRWTNPDGARVRPLVTEIDGVLHLIADAEAFFGRHAAARRPLLTLKIVR